MSCSSRSSFYVVSSDDKEKEELDPLEPPLNATKSERINCGPGSLREPTTSDQVDAEIMKR
ncbi:hypothetical protein YC2023_055617 [Brassica napus]